MVDETKVTTDLETKEQEFITPDLSDEEKDLTTLKTDVDTTILKNTVESSTDTTMLTYIEWSVMHTKLKELETSWEIPDFTIENFSKDINTTVESYLKEAFKKSWSESLHISDSVISSLSIGIQFSMMEALTKSWSDGADFFSAFSKTDTDSASSTFTGLTKAFSSEWLFWKVFGGVGKTNQFYLLANKVESCVSFLTRYCGEGKALGDGTKVEKLANANEFRKLLNNEMRSDPTLLLSKTPEDFWLTISDEVVGEMSDADKDELKKIVDDENMPINAKTVKAIMASLPTAQKFLEKRWWYKNNAVEIMWSFSSLLDKNVFWFGTIGSIIGIQNPMELFTSKDGKKKWWVMNFVLRIMWFQNGMEWLYQEYVRQSIDENLTMEGKQFIKNTLADYDALVEEWDSTTKTVTALGLISLDATAQAKIPSEYEHITKVLYNNVIESEVLLDPKVLTSMWITVDTSEKDADGNVIVKYDKTLITEDKIKTYIKLTIPTLATNADFMTGIKTSDEFMLSLTWWLICGTCFSSAVALGMEQISGYKETSTTTSDSTTDILWSIPKDLSDTGLTKCKMTDTEYTAFAKRVVEISDNLWIQPEYLMKVMSFESGGTLDPSITNGAGSGATGLIQFMPSTAVNLGTTTAKLAKMTAVEQLDYVEKFFLSKKDTLKTLEDVYLAVFSPAFIGKSLSYVAYSTWSAAYTQNKWFDTNKDGKMTVEEITETVRTSTKDLHFFTAAPNTTVDADIENDDNPEILAKTLDDVVLVGDSHAGGIKAMWELSSKTFYYNGYDTWQLLKKIKKEKTTILTKKSMILITWANDITKWLTSKIKDNLASIKNEIAPVQLVLSTLQYYKDKELVPDKKVDEVNTIIKKFAQDSSLPVIDINKNVSLEDVDYQSDKRHLTASWYKKIVENISNEVVWEDNVA